MDKKEMKELSIGVIFNHPIYGNYEVISRINNITYEVLFHNTGGTRLKDKYSIVDGRIKDFYYKSVCNIGYIGYDNSIINIKNHLNYKKIYRCWVNMIKRCYEHPISKEYSHVSVCEEWQSFYNFYLWASNRYKEGYHLDKDINNKQNLIKQYNPENCSFVKPYKNYQKIHNRDNFVYVFKNTVTKNVKYCLNPSDLSHSLGFYRTSLSRLITKKRKRCGNWVFINKQELIYAL